MMTRFEKCKQWLYDNWGYQLFRGEKGNVHGWKSGYIVIGTGYHRWFRTLKAIEDIIAAEAEEE